VQTFEQIKAQIEALPQSEYAKLIDWLSERDAAEWDRAIEQDASSGALDFLIDEAQKERSWANSASSNAQGYVSVLAASPRSAPRCSSIGSQEL